MVDDSTLDDGTTTESDQQAGDILSAFANGFGKAAGDGLIKAAAPDHGAPPQGAGGSGQSNIRTGQPQMPFNTKYLLWGVLGLAAVILVIKAVK